MRTIPYFINDERVDGAGDLLVFNPATGDVNAHVPIADAKLVDDVVTIARGAADGWRNSSLSQRTNVSSRCANSSSNTPTNWRP